MEEMWNLLHETIAKSKKLQANAPHFGSCIAISKNLDKLCHLISSREEAMISDLDELRQKHTCVFEGKFITSYSSAYHESVLNAIAMAQDYFKSCV